MTTTLLHKVSRFFLEDIPQHPSTCIINVQCASGSGGIWDMLPPSDVYPSLCLHVLYWRMLLLCRDGVSVSGKSFTIVCNCHHKVRVGSCISVLGIKHKVCICDTVSKPESQESFTCYIAQSTGWCISTNKVDHILSCCW